MILGNIGNDVHLQSNNPQDHTPFSRTAWPLPLPGYVVTAGDYREGAWADSFLAEVRNGKHLWVKYVNLRGKHYNFKSGNWSQPQVTNSGDIHLHVSARTDRLNDSLVSTPTIPIQEDDEMRPYVMVRDSRNGEDTFGRVYACFGSGAVRWIGPAEYDACKQQGVPMFNSTDGSELDRLKAESDSLV